MLKLDVLRGTQQQALFVPAIEMKDSLDNLSDLVNRPDNLVRRLGVLAADIDDEVRSAMGKLRISSGVIVVARVANFVGVDTGLQTGDVIHRVNQQDVDSLATLRAALAKIIRGDPVVLQVERGGI